MRKGIKIILIAVVVVVGVAMLPATREYAARRAVEWLGRRFDAQIGFDRVHLGLRGDVRFDELYMTDNQGDTLLMGDVGVGIRWGRRIGVRRVTVSDGTADIRLISSKLGGGGRGVEIGSANLRRMTLIYDTITLDNVTLSARDITSNSLTVKELSFDYREHHATLSAPEVGISGRVLTADGMLLTVDDSHLNFERFDVDFATTTASVELRNSSVVLPFITLNNLNIKASGSPLEVRAEVSGRGGEVAIEASGRWLPLERALEVRVDSLTAPVEDILKIKQLPDSLQTMFRRLGNIELKGDFGKNKDSYTADATLSTSLGDATVRGLLSGDNTPYCEVTLLGFDLGHLLAIGDLGRTTAAASLDGHNINVDIANILYKGYDYQRIRASGRLENRRLTAHIVALDRNLRANANWHSNFDTRTHDFTLDIAAADLRNLNLNRRDSISQLRFKARGTVGREIRIIADNILYTNHLGTIATPSITINRTAGELKIATDLSLLGAVVPGLEARGKSSLTATKRGSQSTFTLAADSLKRGGMVLANLRLDGAVHADTIALGGGFNLGTQPWKLAAQELIPRDKSLIINGLSLESEGQRLNVGGVLSAAKTDTLYIGAESFDLAPLSDLLRVGHKIGGQASGRAVVTAALDAPTLTAAVALDSMQIDHVELPDLDFSTSWQGENAHLLLNEAGGKTLLTAIYNPATRRLDGHLDIKNIDLSLLDTHYRRALSGTTGRADLQALIVDGKVAGSILVHDYSATVDYLGVRYAAAPETRLDIAGSKIRFNNVTLHDPENNTARMTAAVDFSNLKNVGYDFLITTPNILILNTSRTDNSQFYGHLYTAATAQITGNKQGTSINVDAETLRGSQFHVPMNDTHDIAEAGFLTFANQPQSSKSRQKRRVTADLAVRVGNETMVELLIDPRTGHNIRTRGNGLLNIHLSPRDGEFTIYGDYRIDQGTYLFTLENIIEKPFVITPGSTLQWTGSPRDAMVDIAAAYSLKTSIAPAIEGSGYETWRMRIPVECRIGLRDRLSAPILSFDVTAPGATPETQSILANFLATEEMTATQFFFLLATGNFYDYASAAADIGAAAGTTTAFDFISNRLSSLIPAENLDIGIRYRPQTETTSDEWGVDFTQQLWGDRLLLEIEGNYDTRNNQSAVYSENQRNFTGDLNLTGVIGRRGVLRAKAFTRTITRFDENQGLQESGAGIYFTEEFNNFAEIFRRRRWVAPRAK